MRAVRVLDLLPGVAEVGPTIVDYDKIGPRYTGCMHAPSAICSTFARFAVSGFLRKLRDRTAITVLAELRLACERV